MTPLSKLFISASALCLLTASLSFAETKREDRSRGGAMPTMLLYEAAEQAAEDSYAEIIPSSPDSEAVKKEVETKAGQAEDTAKEKVEQTPTKTE